MSRQTSINFGQDIQHLANQPLRAKRPQQFTMDIGLFGDDHLQIDLVDLARKAEKEAGK